MISITDLGFSYPGGRTPALDGINLTIEQGSLFGLIGPNGAGKTTLISILTGLLPDRTRSVSVDGAPLARSGKPTGRTTGYVPQDYAFYPDLSALENLEFFAGAQGIPPRSRQARIDYCLDFSQLQSVATQRAGRYSGGLKRRLNLAIGLLADPDILYLDEPTVGIDPQSRAFILDKIRLLNSDGKTVIYTSHYMEEVEQLCDHLAIIDHGRVLLSGPLRQLRQRQKGRLSIDCVQPPPESLLQRLRGRLTPAVSGRRLVFDDVADLQTFSGIVDDLRSQGVEVSAIEYGTRSLENLFLQLTSRALRD